MLQKNTSGFVTKGVSKRIFNCHSAQHPFHRSPKFKEVISRWTVSSEFLV